MTLGLPVSNLINVSIVLTPAGASFQNIDSLLILGPSGRIDTTTRIVEFGSIGEVAEFFQTTDPEYLAALLWFGQSPAPTSLFIGAWAKTATAAALFCAPLTAAEQLISNWTSITTGAFLLYEDGAPLNVEGLSFAADTNLNGVAATIQAALVALEASSTVTWNSVFSRFQFTSGTTGAASTLSFLQTSAAAGKAVFAGQPATTHVLTVDGTAVTFVAAGPVGNQVMIGSTLAITLANLLAFLNSSVDANISLMTYSVTGTTLYMVAKATGTAGNTYTLTTTDGNITPSAPHGGSAGVDLSALLFGQATSSGAYVAEGVAAESAISAVQLFNDSFSGWYALYCCGTSDADTLAIAAFIEATVDPRHYFGVTTQEPGVIISTDTSDIAYLLAQAKYDHTGIQYSSTNPYACVSMLARILTTNWQGINTTIDLMYKQEPGVIAETLGTAQANAISAKNCNVYINYNNGTSIIQMGNSTSGNPIDTIIGLDWLANQIQTDVYNTLYTTTTKVPQTDPGEHAINAAISNACNTGVGNGLLAPGTWNSGGFGQLNQGDYLSKGFYVYQPPVALQPENLRAARQSVIFQVAAKEAGAVRDVAIQVLVNQ